MQKLVLTSILLSFALLTSCDRSVHRVDPDNPEGGETNVSWDIKDINELARTMVGKLENHRLARMNPPAVIRVVRVQNKTEEPNINTEDITGTLISELSNFGSYVVVADAGTDIEDVNNEALYQEQGYMDVGGGSSEVFPTHVLLGHISSIMKRGDGGFRDNSYKFVLKLVNVKRRTIDWQAYRDIRKQQDTSTFGW